MEDIEIVDENIENPPIETVEATIEVPEELAPKEEIEGYQPNFKYKIDDKEFEFDEKLKGVITSKESEDYVRDLVTRAEGLEVVKQKSQDKDRRIQEGASQYTQLRSEHEKMQNGFQQLRDLTQKDLAAFTKVWGISDNQILARAIELVKMKEDPEAQVRDQRSIESSISALQHQQYVAQGNQTQSALQRQLHEMKMSTALADPTISRFAVEFDRKVGKAGAFADEVAKIGTLEYHAGRYLDPQVAVAQAHQNLSRYVGNLAEAAAPASVAPPVKPAGNKAPTLPNMGSGRSGTTTKKKITSTDDLRKLAASYND